MLNEIKIGNNYEIILLDCDEKPQFVSDLTLNLDDRNI